MQLPQFEHYVHQYQQRIFGYACHFLRDEAEAADVTQEVLIRLWKHREEVDEDRMLGWLLRVTRNACIDASRRRKAQRNVMTNDADGIERATDVAWTPDVAAEQALFQEHLRQALDRLREPYRSIVILREVQEMKYEEICGALNLPLNTVKVYLHRARKMLRESLSQVTQREAA